jgi:arylsulfatase
MPAPPNILWLCTDQQRWDTIAALGNTLIRTPHIDSLVADGVAFTNAFCQSTVCSPSRASFLTGRYPRTTGCRQNGQTLPASEKLISRIFADAGYICGLSGKLHLASCSDGKVEVRGDDGYSEFQWSHHPPPDWEENAYSQWLKKQGTSWNEIYNGPTNGFVKEGVPAAFHQTTWCTEMAIDFMRRHRDQPWFFSWNPFDPHHPFDPPPEYLARYNPADMPLPISQPGELESKTRYQQLDHEWAHNNPGEFHVGAMTDDDRRRVTAAYYGMIELIDDQVGRMLAALEETNQVRDTLVIFMSDHGELLGDHGLYFKGPHFYEGSIRVPLIVRYPGQIEQGLKVECLAELLDLAPTLCEATGIPISEAMQGRSLMPHLTGNADPTRHREAVFCEYYNSWTHHRSYGSMLRTKTYKICVYHGIDEGELYDLEADPCEFDNLWDSPAHRQLKQQMLKSAFDASVFTMDPLPPRLGRY